MCRCSLPRSSLGSDACLGSEGATQVPKLGLGLRVPLLLTPTLGGADPPAWGGSAIPAWGGADSLDALLGSLGRLGPVAGCSVLPGSLLLSTMVAPEGCQEALLGSLAGLAPCMHHRS